MLNVDKFRKEIEEIGPLNCGVNKNTHKPMSCCDCKECIFNEGSCNDTDFIDWLFSEYKEPPIDWSKVPIDTKVLVRDTDNEKWMPRHFAGCLNEANGPLVWSNGVTSWTAKNNLQSKVHYHQIKLAEEEK